ncbi:unnamed protein product, partial [Ectocarpus sp. 13 AM-2016]
MLTHLMFPYCSSSRWTPLLRSSRPRSPKGRRRCPPSSLRQWSPSSTPSARPRSGSALRRCSRAATR